MDADADVRHPCPDDTCFACEPNDLAHSGGWVTPNEDGFRTRPCVIAYQQTVADKQAVADQQAVGERRPVAKHKVIRNEKPGASNGRSHRHGLIAVR